ncbi:MAG: hypothetical protein ACRDA4_10050 [Filifactoraceae bacterium]
MSKKKLYGNVVYCIDRKQYGKVKRVYSNSEYSLKTQFSNNESVIKPEKFYEVVKSYYGKAMDGDYKNSFTKTNAVFSIGTGELKPNKKDKYYSVQYISKAVKEKSQEEFKNKKKTIYFSRKELEKEINKSASGVNIEKIRVNRENIGEDISVILHEDEDYRSTDNGKRLFFTYRVLYMEDIKAYNAMIKNMRAVNTSVVALIEKFVKEARDKNTRFSSEVLDEFVENNSKNIVDNWKALNEGLKEKNLLNEAKRLLKRESREAFRYLLGDNEDKIYINEKINKILLSILKDLNAKKLHDIGEKTKWINTNVNNDKHKSIFPTDAFIKSYLQEDSNLFSEVFGKFDLNKFIKAHICGKKENELLGKTELFEKFNKHYEAQFKKEFEQKDKESIKNERTEMVRYIYRYIKGRVEKTVSTGQICHWNVEKIKVKVEESIRNKVLERIIYLGKLKYMELNPNISEFQNFHAFEEWINELYVFYSFFNDSMMEFVKTKNDNKKEFYEYGYSDFCDDENKYLYNFTFKELFGEEEGFKKRKDNIKALRNYVVHYNMDKLEGIFNEKIDRKLVDDLGKLLKNIRVSDEDRADSLNLDIVFKGQGGKYSELIKQISGRAMERNAKGCNLHLYPSLSPYIKIIKSKFSLPEEMEEEDKEIVYQALIYLVKNIYKIDVYTGCFKVENIEDKYRKAQRKASETQNSHAIKALQNYVFDEFIKHMDKEYPKIWEYDNKTDKSLREQIGEKTNFDKSYTLKTIEQSLEIDYELDYSIVIMGILNNPIITSQFMNRCISTAEWINGNNSDSVLSYNRLINIANNLKITLDIQGAWEIEELKKLTKMIDLIGKAELDERDIDKLPYSDADKDKLNQYGCHYFSIELENMEIKFNVDKYKKDGGEKHCITAINQFVKDINKKSKDINLIKQYKKYKDSIAKYDKFIEDNKEKIEEYQKDNKAENIYLQADGKTIVYQRSIIEACYNNSFEKIDKLLASMGLSPINILEGGNSIDEKNIKEVQKWLSNNRISGKTPIVKEIVLDKKKIKGDYDKYKDKYYEYELYQFNKNIINYEIYNKFHEKLINVQGKWIQWIGKFERDMHYIINGLDKVYGDLIEKNTKDEKSRAIKLKENENEFDFEEMHYKFNTAKYPKIYESMKKIGLEKVFDIIKKTEENNIRNYVAHMTFLHKPFEHSIVEKTKEVSELMSYRCLYNSGVERSILNIFKNEVEIPIIKTKKYVNLDKVEELIEPKVKTQFQFEDKTKMSEIVIELINYKV